MQIIFGLCVGLAACWYLYRFISANSDDNPLYLPAPNRAPHPELGANVRLQVGNNDKERQKPNSPRDSQALKADDFTLFDGIGPKIAALLNKNGIFTYQQLADFNALRLIAILQEAEFRVRRTDAKSWSIQAKLAADGNWNDLLAFHDKQRRERKNSTVAA